MNGPYPKWMPHPLISLLVVFFIYALFLPFCGWRNSSWSESLWASPSWSLSSWLSLSKPLCELPKKPCRLNTLGDRKPEKHAVRPKHTQNKKSFSIRHFVRDDYFPLHLCISIWHYRCLYFKQKKKLKYIQIFHKTKIFQTQSYAYKYGELELQSQLGHIAVHACQLGHPLSYPYVAHPSKPTICSMHDKWTNYPTCACYRLPPCNANVKNTYLITLAKQATYLYYTSSCTI